MKNKFPILMKDLRKQKGLSMAQLGEQTSLSDAYISLIESNKRQPSHKAALKLAQVLANNEEQLIEFMTAAGYPNLRPTQFKPVVEVSFTHFTQDVLSHIRQSHYRVAEELISQGLQKFRDTVQIQMLVAHLELARNRSDLAVFAMEAALSARQIYPASQVAWVDIYLNLGVCHFMQATYLSQQNEVSASVTAYQQAAHSFEKALTEQPDHFYVLDEYARCLYNLAHLKHENWKKVVAVYKKMIAERSKLSDPFKIEALCFSALATTRSGKPVLAETLFKQILFMVVDAFTLHAYLCHCCYAYQQTQQQKWLTQASKDLAVFKVEFPEQMPDLKADPELAALFASLDEETV